MRKRLGADRWRELLLEFDSSDSTVAQFCDSTRGYESKGWLKSASLCYFSSGAFRWNVGRSLRCGQLANSRAAIAG